MIWVASEVSASALDYYNTKFKIIHLYWLLIVIESSLLWSYDVQMKTECLSYSRVFKFCSKQQGRKGRGRMIAKVMKYLNLLSRKYSLLCSLLFSYLNNSNEECNEMDHGREQNNHERAKKLSWGEREEKWGTCKLSRHVETIMLLYSLTIVLEILAIDDIRWR